jgi:tetratricopeptide (TPR) repeat protein
MKKALTLDPEFAMAYRSLAVSYSNLSLTKNARESADKAFELSDRVSIRERYLIQAQAERDLDKQIEAYKKLLELYPEDHVGNTNLGVLYFNLEQFDKAIERFNVSIENENIGIQVYMMLANAYGAKGMYDEAKEVLEGYLNNISDNAVIHESLSTVYLCQGEYDLALDEIEKAFSINPNDFGFFRTKGDIFYCKEDLDKAEKEYQKLLEIEEQSAHMLGRKRLGFLYLLQGRIEKTKSQWKQGLELAKKFNEEKCKWDFHSSIAYLYLFSGELKGAWDEFNNAWDNAVEVDRYDRRRNILYWKGRTYLEMKSMDEAKKMAVELKEFIQKGMNKKSIRLYHHLMGMIEFEKENFSAAIEYFNKAISLLPSQNYYYFRFFWAFGYQHAIFIDSLAMAYFKIGDFKRARKEYEKILSLTLGRLYYGDIYAKAFYMLGKINEQQGDTAKAIEHYEKFLDLWKDADPGIAEVEDAKEKLSELKGN